MTESEWAREAEWAHARIAALQSARAELTAALISCRETYRDLESKLFAVEKVCRESDEHCGLGSGFGVVETREIYDAIDCPACLIPAVGPHGRQRAPTHYVGDDCAGVHGGLGPELGTPIRRERA